VGNIHNKASLMLCSCLTRNYHIRIKQQGTKLEMYATGLYIQLPECAEDFLSSRTLLGVLYAILRRYRTLLVRCLRLW